MMDQATLSSKGQIVLPKKLREALGLKPGDQLLFVREGESLRLFPLRALALDDALAQIPGTSRPFAGYETEARAMAEALEAKHRR